MCFAAAGTFAVSAIGANHDACQSTVHIGAGQEASHHASLFENRNKVCTWSVRCGQGGLATITFTSFNLRIRGADSAFSTTINFYDGVDSSAPLLSALSGGDLAESQVASSREMCGPHPCPHPYHTL